MGKKSFLEDTFSAKCVSVQPASQLAPQLAGTSVQQKGEVDVIQSMRLLPAQAQEVTRIGD